METQPSTRGSETLIERIIEATARNEFLIDAESKVQGAGKPFEEPAREESKRCAR